MEDREECTTASDRQPKWFFTIRQSSHSILVEVRPYEGEDGGYIAAFKHTDFESREILPATVKIGLSFAGYGDYKLTECIEKSISELR